ncbi:MAG TPA: ATP-binding cassette domain-containing protein [Bacteroidales bacterium]|nr:ATP-binding cassette domain-containing protein [Bacteroidales bacterium]HNS45964.1 ATP-binding cassette domain-containing protein [Bacteroidales bacterium]
MTNQQGAPLIYAEGLSKTFKNQEVIHNLSICFREGERVSLSGPNGAGKTTLVRCILGHYIFSGILKVLDQDPRKNHEILMRQIGFVPQIPPPLKMTIKEMLDFFPRLTGVPAENFMEISEKMGLSIRDNLSKSFLKLSGGMKQKLLIAFALGRMPKIILMDEPAANLDPLAREVLFDYLNNYKRDSLMIIISHRMSDISKIVNREIEMDLGKISMDKFL